MIIYPHIFRIRQRNIRTLEPRLILLKTRYYYYYIYYYYIYDFVISLLMFRYFKGGSCQLGTHSRKRVMYYILYDIQRSRHLRVSCGAITHKTRARSDFYEWSVVCRRNYQANIARF
jgi:hypothetical protein